MIPILYDYNETAFTSNGLGRLSDCISAVVYEERNGRYDMEFQYPVTGIHFEDITEGRIIAVTHDEGGDIQPFVIYASSKPIDGIVTFNAHHISYRLSDYTIPGKTYVAVSYFQALYDVQGYIDTNVDPFVLNTDIIGSFIAPVRSALPRSVREILGGSENSFLTWIGGEFEFDKWNVTLKYSRGTNSGVNIRYGKNLADFKAETDYSEAYTAIMPYYNGDYGTNQKGVIYYPGVVSAHTLPGNRRVWRVMDFTDKIDGKGKSSATIQNELHTLALDYFNYNNTWDPQVSIDVDFVQLWQTEEYKDYAPLLTCKLCDTVNVSFGMYGLADLAVKIVAVEWDALADRYTKMTLGGLATTLAQSINSSVSGAIKANAEAIAQVDSRSFVTDVTVNGSSVVTDGVAAVTVPSEPTLQSGTVSGSYTGSINYLKFGRMVIFGGTIGTTGALSNGTQLASGLPANNNNGSMSYALNNNSTSENVPVYVTNSGTLLVRGSFSSSSRSLRVSGAYISAS